VDAKTAFEIQEHLDSCPECKSFFAEEQDQDALIKASLKRGERTEVIWGEIERLVAAASVGAEQARHTVPVSRTVGWSRLLLAFGQQLQCGWRGTARAWAGLAVIWVVILVLNFSAREPEPNAIATQGAPSLAEMRHAWKQKEQLMAELGVLPEPAPADKPKTARPNPRSERHNETQNA
jgi:hypothetical protein